MFQRTRRVIIGLSLISMAFLAACGSTKGTQSQALAKDQVLTIANVGVTDPKTFDPALNYDLNSAAAMQMVFTGLINFDPKTLALTPDIATDLPTTANGGITNGGKTYTIHIRQDVKFSNGDPVTAQTVAFSIDRGFAKCLKAQPPIGYLPMIVGVNDRYSGTGTDANSIIGTGPTFGLNVVDNYTLRFNLTAADAYFLAALSYPSSDVLDPNNVPDTHGASCADGSWQDHPIGTGPFVLKEYDKGSKMIFVPNPNWYGAKTKLTEVDMPFFKNVEPAYTAYKQGQLDIDGWGGANITSTDYNDAKTLGNSVFNESPYLSTAYLQGNANIPPFDNVNVRKAFAESIDRKAIATSVLNNTVLSSDHIVPQGMPGYNPNLQGFGNNAPDGFNPTQAKADLQAAYPDLTKMPPVTLLYDNDVEDNVKLVNRLVGDWQLYLGVKVNLKGEGFNQEIGDIFNYNVQFYLTAWIADYPDPQDWLSLQMVTKVPYNANNYSSAQFDNLCNLADVNQDPTSRIAQYQQAEQVAVNDAAWITIDQTKNLYVTKPWVHGFTIDGGGLTPSTVWADVYITQH